MTQHTRLYLFVWGAGYYHPRGLDSAHMEIHPLSWCGDDRGFDTDIRDRLMSLECGESMNLADLTAFASVARVL